MTQGQELHNISFSSASLAAPDSSPTTHAAPAPAPTPATAVGNVTTGPSNDLTGMERKSAHELESQLHLQPHHREPLSSPHAGLDEPSTSSASTPKTEDYVAALLQYAEGRVSVYEVPKVSVSAKGDGLVIETRGAVIASPEVLSPTSLGPSPIGDSSRKMASPTQPAQVIENDQAAPDRAEVHLSAAAAQEVLQSTADSKAALEPSPPSSESGSSQSAIVVNRSEPSATTVVLSLSVPLSSTQQVLDGEENQSTTTGAISYRISRVPFMSDPADDFDYPGLVADDSGELSSGDKSPSTPLSIEDGAVPSPGLKPALQLPTPAAGAGVTVAGVDTPEKQQQQTTLVVTSDELSVIPEEVDTSGAEQPRTKESKETREPTTPRSSHSLRNECLAGSASPLNMALPPLPPHDDAIVNVPVPDKELPPLPPSPPAKTPPKIDTSVSPGRAVPPISRSTGQVITRAFSTAGGSRSTRSIGSSTTSSDERRTTKSRLSSLFSRLTRHGGSSNSSSGNTIAQSSRSRRADSRASWFGEDFIEKRTLTPIELSAPRDLDFGEDQGPSTAADAHVPALPSPVESRIPMGLSVKKEKVFGVSLNDSLKVAKMRVRMSHKGKGNSFRTYPPSVYKCCEFIHNKGLQARRIFSAPGNALNVSQLKEIFSTAPDYGENFEFEGTDYTPEDAARLILLFLEELPQPLVPPRVVKGWILLARQEGAIDPPAPRVETGLDFWIEALNPLPIANRNLVKHLLNLFALLATVSGGLSDTDARRLAGAVSRSLFHPKEKTVADEAALRPTLALAFLIRKRAEYSSTLLFATRSKRDSKMFLPTTKEIMEWKA